LAGMSSRTAADKLLPRAHTIWELVLHITAWERVVTQRLAGRAIDRIPDEQNWPDIPDKSDLAWKLARNDLALAHRQLKEAIGHLDETQLDDPVPGKDYSVYVLLHGLIQHNLYRAGQIALLKKL
jgi:DinB superfamily